MGPEKHKIYQNPGTFFGPFFAIQLGKKWKFWQTCQRGNGRGPYTYIYIYLSLSLLSLSLYLSLSLSVSFSIFLYFSFSAILSLSLSISLYIVSLFSLYCLSLCSLLSRVLFMGMNKGISFHQDWKKAFLFIRIAKRRFWSPQNGALYVPKIALGFRKSAEIAPISEPRLETKTNKLSKKQDLCIYKYIGIFI